MALGGPHLLTVDHPLVAIEHSRCLQTGQIRSRVRLGETLAPARAALEDAGKKLTLLLLGSPLQQGRTHQCVTEEVAAHRRTSTGEFFGQHHPLHGGQPFPAVLGGPGRTDPPTFEQLLGPGTVEFGTFVRGHIESLVEPAIGQVVLEPRPDVDAEFLGFGGVREIHGHSLPERAYRSVTVVTITSFGSPFGQKHGVHTPPTQPTRAPATLRA